MFDQLFKQPAALARHQDAPLASERAAFLAARAADGAAPQTLVRLARELLAIVRELDLTAGESIGLATIKTAAEHWAKQQHLRHRTRTRHWSRILFCQTATAWSHLRCSVFPGPVECRRRPSRPVNRSSGAVADAKQRVRAYKCDSL
jgi:hypothetical protein